jgi:O-antigen ligase
MLKNVSYYLILLFLVCLPFDQFYSEAAFIGLIVHTVLTGTRDNWKKLWDKRVLALQVIYWITLLATTYTRYRELALVDWVQQLPLLLWPWLACVLQPVLQSRKNDLLGAFALSCCATVLYLFWCALEAIHYFHMPWRALFSHFFVNQNFSEPLDLHATYLSLYVALSLAYCLTQIVGSGPTGTPFMGSGFRPRKLLYAAGILILVAGLVQLSSKSALAATWLVLMIGIPCFLFPARRRAATFRIMAVLTLTLVLGGLLLQAASFRTRIVTDLTRDVMQDRTADPLNEPRMVRWAVAWKLIRSAPLAGYGSGSEMPLLKDAYYREQLFEPYLYGLNTHNQFLRSWLTTGLAGLLVYLGMLGFAFARAWKNKDLVWTCFLVLVTVVSFAENILDVQKGIFFFSFFFSFFIFYGRPPDPGEPSSSPSIPYKP